MASASGSFADTLRRAIDDRGLGLERIQAHLDERGASVSVATLSYWSSGRSLPERRRSLDALPHLEQILGLQPGALVTTLPPARKRARRQAVAALGTIWPETPQTRVLRRLDTSWDEQLDRMSLHEVMEIGRDRTQRQLLVRQVLRARTDGPDRRVVLHCVDDANAGLPFLQPVQGCTMTNVQYDQAGVVGAELVFPRPLRCGETHIVEYRVLAQDPAPTESHYHRRFRLPMRLHILEVKFHPEALPTRVELMRGDEIRPVTIGPDHRVHHVEADCPAGASGVRWYWPDPPSS